MCEYDYQQIMAQVQQMFISLAIIAFIHLQWGYIPPLIMQTVLSIKNLVGTPLFRVHVNKREVGWVRVEDILGSP